MASNLYFTFKKGEIGKVINFTIMSDGSPLNLTTPTDFTVTLAIAKDKNTTPVITGGTVSKSNQTTNPGECSHTLTGGTGGSAMIDVGIYKACELKLTAGSNVLYWPCNKNDQRTYFTVEVQQPIS